MPVLPVIVSQAQDLLLLVYAASTGGDGEVRAQDGEAPPSPSLRLTGRQSSLSLCRDENQKHDNCNISLGGPGQRERQRLRLSALLLPSHIAAGPALLSLTSRQGGGLPVLPVIVSQGQNLLHLDVVVSLGGKSELRVQVGGKCSTAILKLLELLGSNPPTTIRWLGSVRLQLLASK